MSQRHLLVTDAVAILQDAFVTAVQTVKTADPLAPLTVVVPNNPLALRLRRAVAWTSTGHFGLRFLTLIDFARDLAEEGLIHEGRRPLPLLAAPRIVKKLLSETDTHDYFAPLVSLPGFPRAFLETITDFKQAGIQPHHLSAFIEQVRLKGTYRHKVESLADLYERYVHFLTEHQFYDNDDLIERAASLLETTPETAPLFLYGFYDFTPLQRRFVAAALRNRDVLAFFPWRPGSAYEYATPTLSWLTSLGLQYTPLSAPPEQETDLIRVQISLFEETPRVAPTPKLDGSVSFLAAPNQSREAREIGRVILALVRDWGLRFSEIGILLRDSATYGPLLAETFTGFGIPFFLYGGLPLLQTPTGQGLSLLCRMLAEDYSRSRVMEFLGVGNLPFSELLGELAAYARPDRWEAFSLEAGIVKGVREWRERLPRLERDRQQRLTDDDRTDSEDQHVLRAFVVFMEGLLSWSDSTPQVNTWRGWAEHTLQLLRAYISPTLHTPQVEDELMRLAQLDLLNEPISIQEWSRGVTTALATATVSTGQFDTEGVFIGDLLAARGVRFRVVIVPGLIEGSFPRTVRQDPFLLDAERQHLAETLTCDLPQRGRCSEEERVLFCLAAQSAIDKLVLTYPRLDQTNDHVQVPSLYLLRTVEALSGKVVSFPDLEAWCVRVPLTPFYAGPSDRATDTIEFHLTSVERALATGDPTPLGYLSAITPDFSHALCATHQRWEVPQLTIFDGMLENETVRTTLLRHLFPAGLIFSASDLETYARCPFRYFLSVVLGLTPQERPEQVFTVHPRDRGALLHAILADFFSRLRATGRLPLRAHDRSEFSRLLTQVVEEHCHAFAQTHATGFPLLWDIEQERLHEQLALLLKQESQAHDEFLPAAFESRFGMQTRDNLAPFFPTEPVRFMLENGEEIGLHGRIDRIDVFPDQRQARILDYKTGNPPRGRFARGLILQLPLYMFAARTLRPDLAWVSAQYVCVGQISPGMTPMFTADTWQETLVVLRQLVTNLVHGIRSGCFFPTPDTCYPCPFSAICGTQTDKQVTRKRGDSRWDVLHQVRAIA